MERSGHYNAWYCEWKACERLEDCWLSPSPSDQQTKSKVQRGRGWRKSKKEWKEEKLVVFTKCECWICVEHKATYINRSISHFKSDLIYESHILLYVWLKFPNTYLECKCGFCSLKEMRKKEFFVYHNILSKTTMTSIWFHNRSLRS